MPHANTLVATTQQLAAGLGFAAATLALRLGGTLDWPAFCAAARP